jgi:hypothetical protein
MSLQKPGSVSENFPLYHTNLIPVYPNKEKISHKPHKNKFIVTNEHPDFFKLEGMKEEGYKNPYLNEVIKVDRSECFKEIDSARKQLNLINFINSNRKYSQDPKILKYIINAEAKDIKTKREHILKKRSNTQQNNYNNNINNYKQMAVRDKIANTLEKYIPKIDYKMTRTIDYSKPVKTEYDSLNDLKSSRGIDAERKNRNLLKKYNFFFNEKKSAYLKNFNDYKISEAQQRDLYKGFNYQRKPSFKYNLFKGKYDTIVPPEHRGESWSSFHENFYTIKSNRNQFRIKGGLFSEFSDKNKNVISINKRELREKVERERELRKNLKNNKYQTSNNTNTNYFNAFH